MEALRLCSVTQQLELVPGHNWSWRGTRYTVTPPSPGMGNDAPLVACALALIDSR